jgi:4a-hydroxytetrahydrobiopterin dehydratase
MSDDRRTELRKKRCVPCEGGAKPLSREQAEVHAELLEGWTLDGEAKRISKEFRFKYFVQGMSFVQAVADIAETEGHHPYIHVFYNTVRLELSTHAIDGLSENDFILAAKIDYLQSQDS